MLLLNEAVEQIRAAVRAGDEDAASAVFWRVVGERTEAMHQRAQTAESRAHKAERDLERYVNRGAPWAGQKTVYPVKLQHDQTLEVVINADGTLAQVRVLMPPCVNYKRLPHVLRENERRAREAEWAKLEAERW